MEYTFAPLDLMFAKAACPGVSRNVTLRFIEGRYTEKAYFGIVRREELLMIYVRLRKLRYLKTLRCVA